MGSSGVCYTFQPETAAVSFRQLGTIRDWDGHVDRDARRGPPRPSRRTCSPDPSDERPMNLTLLLDMAASGFDDRVAFGTRAGGVTYAELQARANTGAARAA